MNTKHERSGEQDVTHTLTMEVQNEPRMFRAVCSCGRYVGPWATTNACMGGGHRHVAAMRRRRSTPPASTDDHQPNRCCDYHRHIADGCCHCDQSNPPGKEVS